MKKYILMALISLSIINLKASEIIQSLRYSISQEENILCERAANSLYLQLIAKRADYDNSFDKTQFLKNFEFIKQYFMQIMNEYQNLIDKAESGYLTSKDVETFNNLTDQNKGNKDLVNSLNFLDQLDPIARETKALQNLQQYCNANFNSSFGWIKCFFYNYLIKNRISARYHIKEYYHGLLPWIFIAKFAEKLKAEDQMIRSSL